MGERQGAGTRRVWVALVAGLALLGASVAVQADDPQPLNWNRPAATLLLPYFEIDLADASGATTIFSINNGSATAILSHVTIWSDLAVAVLAFNVYLTGYDVQEVDLGDLVRNGILPITASAGQDPQDTRSPHGAFSQDINFASCSGQLPFPSPALSFPQLQGLQAGLTGAFDGLLGGCCGFNFGDSRARGFVTVDTVNNCTTKFPGEPGYFVSGGIGDATNQNVLYGDYYAINPRAGVGRGHPLVHVLASRGVGVNGTWGTFAAPGDPAVNTAGRYTFYGRLTGTPWTAADNRFPLATIFAARFRNSTTEGTVAAPSAGRPPSGSPELLFTGPTLLEVWRDPKVAQQPFPCGTLPPWVPLNQEGIVFFDEEENPFVLPSHRPFGLATQRVQVGGSDLPTPFAAGWIYLNLNTTVLGQSPNLSFDPAAAQAWVTIVEHAAPSSGGAGRPGEFSTGFHAVPLDSAVTVNHFTPPPP